MAHALRGAEPYAPVQQLTTRYLGDPGWYAVPYLSPHPPSLLLLMTPLSLLGAAARALQGTTAAVDAVRAPALLNAGGAAGLAGLLQAAGLVAAALAMAWRLPAAEAMALVIAASLLVAPVTWDVYLVLLLRQPRWCCATDPPWWRRPAYSPPSGSSTVG